MTQPKTKRHTILMCPPDHYGVEYVINPWMEGNQSRATVERAREQWRALSALVAEHASVELLEPHKGVPDLVFTANAGLVMGKKFILSRFRHVERQAEEPYFAEWFEARGYEVIRPPADLFFEGAGDALFDRGADRLWMGYGWRTRLEACAFVAEKLGVEVLPLRLVDDRFYHLDTCFCPLTGGYLFYYPKAFDARAQRLIEELVPEDRRFAVSERDAVHFACNAIDTGDAIIMNNCTPELEERLRTWGFQVVRTPMTEFILAGGASKCLSLRLTEDVVPPRAPRAGKAELVRRVVRLEGHLLDGGVLARVMDTITNAGGSFEVLEFHAGARREDLSTARVSVNALSAAHLELILSQLLDVGVQVDDIGHVPATLVTVDHDGVAPEDFYCTTIFPTDVLVGAQWVRCSGQRMDGVVVVDTKSTPPTASVSLLRNLRRGDRVVTGMEGIRIHTRKEVGADSEFKFMSSSVSSERRVEVAVENIAWEMMQIRNRAGRIVLVTGPVAVHTGGIDHLCKLVKMGYVSALLSGNALAVHDIERALYGTSLGVDLKSGSTVHGGHRHHLSGINAIRRAGNITEAVHKGVLRQGLMYELVTNNIPFSLAGSIRDDGPLPDTRMNLLDAQAEYARLLQGSEMVLMLATMLHSIGVGNMVPSGVKLVCVDINTSVATKLADRGSVESVPVVTDVGLFLNLLVRKLVELQMEPAPATRS